jgi:transcriptional regulator with XRE-family HTH domain/Zn-dependent peptidase ImmA (M78 family)
MPLDRETIGRNLRNARNNRGISQKQAAKHVGLSRSLIAQIELGNRPVSSDELAKLAALYQKPVEEFSPDVAQSEDDALARVLKVAPTLPADLKRALASFIGLCREAAALENSLGRPRLLGPPRYELAAPRNTADAIVQGEQIASQERQRLGFGPGSAVGSVSDLVVSQGVRAAVMRFPEDVLEIFVRHRTLGPLVAVSSADATSRRFDLLHGYAHALIEWDQSTFVTTPLDSDDLVETRANAFATAFLLPREGIERSIAGLDKGRPSRRALAVFGLAAEEAAEAVVRSAPGSQTLTCHDVADIARRFGTTYRATVHRLRSLDLISKPDTKQLLAPKQQRAANANSILFSASSEGDLPLAPDENLELKSRVALLAIEAYRRQLVDKAALGALAAKLQISGLTSAAFLELAEAAR